MTTPDIQIITVLCKTVQNATQLLTNLESKYPDSNWNSTILGIRLSIGLQQGRYTTIYNSNPLLYQVNPNMVQVNPANSIYVPFCSIIKPVYNCPV